MIRKRTMRIKVKRIYDASHETDGIRILVDRIWPRGLTKASANVDKWLREIAPSNELRRWFGHDPNKWDEFRRRYFLELSDNEKIVRTIRDTAVLNPVTLLFAAKDIRHNNAQVLRASNKTHCLGIASR